MDTLTHWATGGEDVASESDGGIADHGDGLHSRIGTIWPGTAAYRNRTLGTQR